MGIRLSPLGMAVFCLLGLGVLYHLYSGFLAGRFAFFMLGVPAAEAPAGSVDLRELLAAAVRAAIEGGEEVRRVREDNVLNEKAKGKTREGADELMTTGDFLSNRKMYYLLKTAFPGVQVGPAAFPAPLQSRGGRAWRRGASAPEASVPGPPICARVDCLTRSRALGPLVLGCALRLGDTGRQGGNAGD